MLLIDTLCSQKQPGRPRTDANAQHICLNCDLDVRWKNTSVVWCVRGSGERRNFQKVAIGMKHMMCCTCHAPLCLDNNRLCLTSTTGLSIIVNNMTIQTTPCNMFVLCAYMHYIHA